MALRPEISLGARTADVGQAFSNALLNVQRGQQIGQARREAPLRNRLLEAQAGQAEAGVVESGQLNTIRSLAVFANDISGDLQRGNLAGIREKTAQRIAQDLPNQGLPSTESQDLLTNVIDNPNLTDPQKLAEVSRLSQKITQSAQQFGVLKAPSASQQTKFIGTPSRTTSGGKNFLTGIVRQPDGTFIEKSVPIEGEFVSILGETAAEKAATAATQAEAVAAATVTGTAKAQAKSAPLIAKTKSFINTQVKLAEKAAIERGDVLTDLNRAKAALPGLTDVVNKLRELAPIATSTFGGRVWDLAVKESGFGATKGATASTKFGAMVNNQVLPLLKPTFGAAFTVPEGDALRATMGDVNASVEEKMATLDAFMEQKQRDIETKQLQLDQASGAPTVTTQAQFDALPSGATYTQSNGEVFTKP